MRRPPRRHGEPDPFTHIFHNLFLDAKRLPSIDTAITLGVGGGLALAVHPFDDEVTEHATAGGPKTFYEVGSNLGDGWVQVGFAVGTYATGLIAHKTSATHLGSDLIRAQVINVVVTQGVKFAVRRERPGNPSGTSYSFPSGHTSSAFATAAVVWRHFGWKAGVPASAIGVWVGAGRVQLGKPLPQRRGLWRRGRNDVGADGDHRARQETGRGDAGARARWRRHRLHAHRTLRRAEAAARACRLDL